MSSLDAIADYSSYGDDCGCLAAVEMDPHYPDEHTNCGMSNQGGAACGDCHSCLSAQIAYHEKLSREHP